ncbi:MAG TPA: glutathione S-transferase family protein [Rhodanobacteraceae bacterium]|jgi:glutathione S-transferase|nr:glutathione S-transferase family protein [Rhodanobacteraceae bacterium]
MFSLYIANKNYSSWSLRPWVLLRERGIPFEEKLVQFETGSSWEKFRTFSPSGKVPCLVDGDTVVWDSLAIAEYVAESHPGVWPADAAARAFARSAAAEMHSGFPALREQCTMNCGIRVKLHRIGEALSRDLARVDELWNEGLARFGGPFLAGAEFTAADAFYAPVAFRIQTYSPPLGDRGDDYARRLLALPSMQGWYASALAETWRDAAHEAEVAQWGTLTQDLRAVA